MKELLHGAYDVHVHTSPDVCPRKCNDTELAKRLSAAKMAGCIIKCHYNDTAARAVLLQSQFPQLHIAGGVTLNKAVGGINPHAVVSSAKIGGKMVWFPTMDSVSYQRFRKPDITGEEAASLLSVCGTDGKMLAAARDVLDVAKEYNMIVATGHIGPFEGMALVHEAAVRGVRCVLTHADNPANRYSPEQMREAVQCGALVEFCYFTVYYERTPIEDIAGYIRDLGIENILLSSDFGQVDSPYSDEGIALFMSRLLAHGFSEREIHQLFCDNPQKLLA